MICASIAPLMLAAMLEVETGTSYHCAVRPATNLTARIELDGDVLAKWKGSVEFRDYFGKTFGVPVDAWGAKGTPIRVKLPEPPAIGLWRGTARLVSADGKTADAKGNFAVLDPHPVTPLAPCDSFRIGINYHVTRYYPQLRCQTMDALVGVGAKLMRGDLAAMCLVETKEDEYHWEKTDEIVNELQAHGIAIDAIVSTVPAWARHPDYASVSNGPTWIVPMREGLAERYGKALAARYGTKIEYYEIGNELDLAPKSHLTVEQAMARQREYYRGIKTACPEAKVIPGGWALADSSPWMVKQKGFQETFMREAQDVCDFHPIHVHASYDKYRNEMLKFFAWREKEGVTIPWYANETAASSCAGQEDAAAMWVWQKPLWAWAHGSVDYIWYNLRSIGPDPNNGEHAYGIFTMDLQPRATAAAFSALTAVFNGLTFERVLHDSASCQLYAFTGKDARTLVGWDSFVRTPRAVTVMTDAVGCESVDIMGNRRPVEVKEGKATIVLDKFPMAYVFAGATRVTPDAAALATESARALAEVLVEPSEKCPDKPSLVLDSMASYKGFCDGNAETEHRLWKGPQDLSAKLFIWKPQWETVHARLEVADDRVVECKRGKDLGRAGVPSPAADGDGTPSLPDAATAIPKPGAGDHIRVVFNDKEHFYVPTKVEDGKLVYLFDMEWQAVPGPLTFEVYDDDGEGLDGYLGGDGYLLKYR